MWFARKKAVGVKFDGTSLEALMRLFSEMQLSLKDSLAAYRDALGYLEQHAPAIATPIRDSFRKDLRALATVVGTAVEGRHLGELSSKLEGSVKRYSRDLETYFREHEDEAKQVLAMMAVLAESMAARERNYALRFRDIARKTRLLVATQDISLIRQRLSEEMTQLEKYVEDMDRDTEQAVAQLKDDIRTIRERHDVTWDPTPVDPN